jgi:hypothetical protein
VTAEPEPGLPGVDEYAHQLGDAHRTATWPGIPPAEELTTATAAHDPTADLRELILHLLQR